MRRSMKALSSLMLAAALTLDFAAPVLADAGTDSLPAEWKTDREIVLEDPAPWNQAELMQAVDVTDPGSVAAYWVWSVNRLTENYDDGMEMMKYLFADIEVFGRGFTEGGLSGKAGWDSYFNERLKSPDYRWLPGAYFKGTAAENGFRAPRPLTAVLHYNRPNTETLNGQTYEQLGRLNIVYWVMSNAAGNKVNLTLSRFDGSNRWYVTNSGASSALFYDQRAALTNAARGIQAETPADTSTAAEHAARYGGR